MIDTYQYIEALTAKGMEKDVAEVVVQMHTHQYSHLATKSDLEILEAHSLKNFSELKTLISDVKFDIIRWATIPLLLTIISLLVGIFIK